MEGFKQDMAGRWVAVGNIKEVDKLRDELVKELISKAQVAQNELKEQLNSMMCDVDSFIGLSAEKYNVTIGGAKGNVTLFSFDGNYKITVANHDFISFDERLQAAKALIDELLIEWTTDSSSQIKTIVLDAFNVDKEGRINTARILSLRRLDIDNEKWRRAMTIISDAMQVRKTKRYIRFYRKDSNGGYESISLDAAKLLGA